MTGTNGGIVIVAADDPSMHSSQDEQDSRFYGKFAMVPVFEPSSQQEAYDMVIEAFEYSEKEHLPVLMRVTTRMAHSRAVVEVKDDGDGDAEGFVKRADHRGDDFVAAHIFGGTHGNAEDDRALLGFGLEEDRFGPFEVVDVEMADGVVFVMGFLQHAGCID
jgi:hypothetical protein